MMAGQQHSSSLLPPATPPAAQSDPHIVASLALSLLQADALSTLFSISSPLLQERCLLLGGTNTSSPFPDNETESRSHARDLRTLFQWQADHALDLVSKFDAGRDITPASVIYYRMWDAETLHASLPFSEAGSTTGVVVLEQDLKTRAWMYHNLLEVAEAAFLGGWETSIESAVEDLGRRKAVADVGLSGEERRYWDLYDTCVENEKAEQHTSDKEPQAIPDDGEDGDGDDYWSSYDAAGLPSY
ncbi:uncharacterized protein EV422DRAFT_533607 [Fimicolochytrium jonesii]|uniref:uncharacterized protein n=1 Tax=Fimicolochytrium jonesii TaxID=1396493 RepID=UPI0022FF276A|nr:uncharacterized protein EV422DRAFT_533607 [Fimicolochytrium jonesii]KAI8819601.1 hypothetical protein EV422DRAFT_533607 [Fimicolochytrium jonesii]